MKNLSAIKVLLAVAIVVIGFLFFKLKTQQPIVKYVAKSENSIIDEAKVNAKVLAREVDNKGFSKAVFERKNEIIAGGDISKLPISKAVFDSLRLDNIDKSKKLQQASYLTATFEAKSLRATKQLDSLKNQYFLYTDEFATATFRPDSLGGEFGINYKIKLARHDYTKKNFLSPPTYYTDILSPDKRITIDGLQSLSFSNTKPTKYGVGLQIGYYYDPQKKKLIPAFGLGISYNLIRF